jgi:hypothetical protein
VISIAHSTFLSNFFRVLAPLVVIKISCGVVYKYISLLRASLLD